MTRRDLLLAAAAGLLQMVQGCLGRPRTAGGPARDLGRFPPQRPGTKNRVASEIASLNRVADGFYHFTHHHAAAYCIWREILLGRLPRRGSILVNLDCHIDALLPIGAPNPADREPAYAALDDPALAAGAKLERLAQFLDQHIDLASWITPLIESEIISEWHYVVPHRLGLDLARDQTVVKRWFARWRDRTGLPEGVEPPRVPEGFTNHVVRLEGLPPAHHFRERPVILSLDLDYYSNYQRTFDFEKRPRRPSTPDEINVEVAATVKALGARRLTRPALIVTASSPQWVPNDQIDWIRTQVLAAFERYVIAPQPWAPQAGVA